MRSRANPLIYIQNKSDGFLKDEEIIQLAAAVQRQVTEHFQPVWGIGAHLVFAKGNVPRDAYRINIYKEAKEEGDEDFLGYHFSPEGYPVASIFAEKDMKKDRTISDTLSHEVLEMLVDPACNLYAYRPSDVGRPERIYFYEVCDAVQCHHYDIDDVKVCNFVYPEWFESNWPAGSRKFDHLGLLDHPFHVLPECYADIYEARRGSITVWGKDSVEKRQRKRTRFGARKDKMNFGNTGAAPAHQV